MDIVENADIASMPTTLKGTPITIPLNRQRWKAVEECEPRIEFYSTVFCWTKNAVTAERLTQSFLISTMCVERKPNAWPTWLEAPTNGKPFFERSENVKSDAPTATGKGIRVISEIVTRPVYQSGKGGAIPTITLHL